ncbi:CalY family protein [Brevibacillus ruminantium]|uniref:CalY family protein n=1 Tax=Brevibacillus ruminantium TaxID=2950604 RepID=A0ABY4WHF2_9BACL|nr:TasA family protein [Brevibacillus ruminantium]USG66294.1 CalY family protein [Brevibacillus ruminantium]
MGLKKQFAVTLASVGLGAALIGGGTFAWFNATTAIENNTFAAGKMEIGATPAESVFQVENMKPGDWFERTFEITNTGTIDINKLLMSIDYSINDVKGDNGADDLDNHLKVYWLSSADPNIPVSERIIIHPRNGKTLKELKAGGDLDISSWATKLLTLPPDTTDEIYLGIEFHDDNTDQNRFQEDSLNLTLKLEGKQTAGEPK